MKAKIGDLIKIEWFDIWSESVWTDEDKAKKSKPAFIVDVGILLKKTKKRVVIANSMSQDKQCSFTVFPRGVIRKIRKLQWQQKKK